MVFSVRVDGTVYSEQSTTRLPYAIIGRKAPQAAQDLTADAGPPASRRVIAWYMSREDAEVGLADIFREQGFSDLEIVHTTEES